MHGMDWLRALDFDRALKNVRTDIAGDWYRDPWDWCELGWLVPDHLDAFAIPRLNATGVKATVPLDVPKENFAVRPAVVLDPLDRLLYQALIDRLSVRLIGGLHSWAYGWRLPQPHPKPGMYARNDEQWEGFRSHLKKLANYDTVALTTDVVSFFRSIPSDPLMEQILELGNNRPAERLADMVAAWYRGTGRGLPQRCAASAVLAHLYLRPLDDVLHHYSEMPRVGQALVPEGRSLRWMDDVWVFGRSILALREAQVGIQGSLRQLGLEMNVGKTQVLEDEEMTNTVFEIEHSAVDEGVRREIPDEAPLDQLIDRLMTKPEVAERTSIRFATTRMRRQSLFKRVADLAEIAPRMPHASDHLARLFRDSEHWRDLQEWYVSYAKRWRTRLPWSVGQFGTMFPSSATVGPAVVDTFGHALEARGTPLPILSVAAQRVAAWRPAEARLLLREAAGAEGHPLATRSLALAALHAGEVRNVVRGMLQQHEENAAILAMLEDSGFDKRAVPVSADFSG